MCWVISAKKSSGSPRKKYNKKVPVFFTGTESPYEAERSEKYLEVAFYACLQLFISQNGKRLACGFDRPIQNLACLGNFDNSCQTKGTTRNILDKTTHSRLIILGNIYAIADTETRVLPAFHVIDDLRVYFLIFEQKIEDVFLPLFEKPLCWYLFDINKLSGFQENPAWHD
jgi:hypothetical protein